MNANVFTRFDKQFDVEGLKEDLRNINTSDTQYKDVPLGTYEVKIEKLELVESKSGKPMVSCWMRILDGEHKNSMLFMNQVIHTPFGLHNANDFLRSLESSVEVDFENFTQYNNMLLSIHEVIDGSNEYAVEYGETNKGFKTFKITDVFEVEQ